MAEDYIIGDCPKTMIKRLWLWENEKPQTCKATCSHEGNCLTARKIKIGAYFEVLKAKLKIFFMWHSGKSFKGTKV